MLDNPSLHRTFDPSRLNEVANHPAVFPWLGATKPIDIGPVLESPLNVALVGDGGGFVLERQEAGYYEGHSLFLPGSSTIDASWEMLRYLFSRTDALELVTKISENNKAALGLARALGFAKTHQREAAWPYDGVLIGCSYWSMSLMKWAMHDPGCLEAGNRFHEQLESSPAFLHHDDPAHDHAAGAAYLMALSGQGRRAVWFYNRWARQAGFPGVRLLSEAPIIIDTGEGALAHVVDGRMEVLTCR